MTRSDRERRDAEKVARRAKRLADRAEQRASRKGEQAQQAADRAEELSARANRRKGPKDRQRDLDKSIEDYVDNVAEKWSRKAEDWIDEQSKKLFDDVSNETGTAKDDYSGDYSGDYSDNYSDDYVDDHRDSAEVEARKARKHAAIARKAAEKAAAYARRTSRSERTERPSRSKLRRSARRSTRRIASKRRRSGNLYRDTQHKKILGVCAGSAEYLGLSTWQVRLGAVFGLLFVPSVAIPAYFITYFLMDNKPYYRQAVDRYESIHAEDEEGQVENKSRGERKTTQKNVMNNAQAMRTARHKFSDIEDRLRRMESHVTSSQFELQRELKKISGED